MRIALAAFVVVTAAPHLARAENGSLEVAAGLSVPVAEDEYADIIDESFKLAVRAVMARTPRSAFELGFDWTPSNYQAPLIGDLEVDVDRFRILFGGRFGAPIGTRARAFGRVAAGVDIVSVTASSEFLNAESSERDVGLGLEFGGGIAVDVGPIDIGVQVAIPIAFHFDDDDPADNDDADLEYTAVDLDLLVFAAVGF